MDGCLSFKEQSKNYIYLHLAPSDPTKQSQHWNIDQSGRIMESSKLMCLFEESPFVTENDYAETPMVMNANRVCTLWSFVPILDENNQPVCADLKKKTPSRLS